MTYEINVRIKVTDFCGRINCGFWFENPILKESSLFSEDIRNGESNMEFVKRIKSYIKSKDFLKKLKSTIIKDVEKYNKDEKLKMNLNDVKKELDGFTFNVKIDID